MTNQASEILDAERSVLVVVDLQGKLMEMVARPKMVVTNTIRLLKLAELFRVPVVLTEQYPKGIGPTHADVKAAFDAFTGTKRYVSKTSFGCCGDEGFRNALDEVCSGVPPNRRQVVVCGIEAHVCVMQTVLELRRTEHGVHVSWDAVSGRGEEYRRHALERMAAAGAVVTNHESVGFEWARDKKHESFSAMSALFKEGQVC